MNGKILVTYCFDIRSSHSEQIERIVRSKTITYPKPVSEVDDINNIQIIVAGFLKEEGWYYDTKSLQILHFQRLEIPE